MQITTVPHPTPTAIELQLDGRFDAHEAPAFRGMVDEAVEGGNSEVRVNLGKVEFIDSTALAELVRGMKRCRQEGGDLILVSPSDSVRVILELTKLDSAFSIH